MMRGGRRGETSSSCTCDPWVGYEVGAVIVCTHETNLLICSFEVNLTASYDGVQVPGPLSKCYMLRDSEEF